jgi:transposase
MMTAILGLDISKETIDACLIDVSGEHVKKVSNNARGFEQLKRWLQNRKQKDVHVCMEATGSYYEGVAEAFADDGYLVSVVNPRQIKAFSETLLLRAKTDKLDANIIARFCRAHQPPAWAPPPPEQRKLRGLVRFCANLKESRASYLVQRETPNMVPEVKTSMAQLIADFDEQIEKLEAEIDDLIDNDPDLRRRRDLLCSVQGIAKTTAATILVEAPNLEEFADAGAVAAFAGLSSRTRLSGTSVRGRGGICKTGNARLRRALWWPAIVAMRHNPRLRAFAERLRALGKPNKKIIIAAMRKLLVLAYGVLKSGRPFDGALTSS